MLQLPCFRRCSFRRSNEILNRIAWRSFSAASSTIPPHINERKIQRNKNPASPAPGALAHAQTSSPKQKEKNLTPVLLAAPRYSTHRSIACSLQLINCKLQLAACNSRSAQHKSKRKTKIRSQGFFSLLALRTPVQLPLSSARRLSQESPRFLHPNTKNVNQLRASIPLPNSSTRTREDHQKRNPTQLGLLQAPKTNPEIQRRHRFNRCAAFLVPQPLVVIKNHLLPNLIHHADKRNQIPHATVPFLRSEWSKTKRKKIRE